MTFRSSACIPLADPGVVLHRLLAEAEGHEADVRRADAARATIRVGPSDIEFSAFEDRLDVSVVARSESILFFLKESLVRQLAGQDAAAAVRLRWSDAQVSGANTMNAGARPAGFHELRLTGRSGPGEAPMEGLIRLRLQGAGDLTGLAGPGLHVKLMLPATGGADGSARERAPVWPTVADNGTTVWPRGVDALHVRYYTIRRADPARGTVDIDVVAHDGGRLADWAVNAPPGARIGVLGPGGGELPERTETVLLAGDRTALPALARMAASLPPDVRGHLIAEASDPQALARYIGEGAKADAAPVPPGLRLHALPPGRFAREIREQAAMLGACSRFDFAWFAGEHAIAQEMRTLFKAGFALPKGRQYAITYWRNGASLRAD